jgi:1-hydroxycarotenoid 3,4-desaturase
MRTPRIAVVGAGAGGLVCALELALKGLDVVLLERAASPGGKLRTLAVDGWHVDAGPTVFTMRWVFDQIFADAGTSLEEHLVLRPLTCLARHAWSATERLDLYGDIDRTADAIGAFAGAAEARGYREFCVRARSVYAALEGPFIRSAQPTPFSLARDAGFGGLGNLLLISPFTSLWRALADHFRDPRLQQLFGRYATYCGSSPFRAPATLMLIAHVEQTGVWAIEGGMYSLVEALAGLARKHGVAIHCGAHVVEIVTSRAKVTGVRLASGEHLDCDAVVVNADVAALAAGRFGSEVARAVPPVARRDRSLSAVTWALSAEATGFPLVRHNVFFSGDYAREFDEMLEHTSLPSEPTVYICAQQRLDNDTAPSGRPEPLLCLVNAPASGDSRDFSPMEIEQCEARVLQNLVRCGLSLQFRPEAKVVTTPKDFEALFPQTGGALYGQATHGWSAAFSRPTARTRIPGLYLAGGSAHPGAGVPMAAMSGWLAAASVTADLTSRKQ